MDEIRTVSQKWLANELDLHFLTLKKCTKGQSNRSILSKVIMLTNYKSTDRQTDRHTDADIPDYLGYSQNILTFFWNIFKFENILGISLGHPNFRPAEYPWDNPRQK